MASLAGDFHLALRRAVNHVVYGGAGLPEKGLQIRPGGGQGGEDKPPVALRPGDWSHAEGWVALVETHLLIAGGTGLGAQRTIGLVGPAVIGASEQTPGRHAGSGLADHGSPVPATVQQYRYVAALDIPNHDHRGQPQGSRYVPTRRFNLALMARVKPSLPPDPLHLQGENLLADIEVPVRSGRFNQGFNRLHNQPVSVISLHSCNFPIIPQAIPRWRKNREESRLSRSSPGPRWRS